MTGVPPSGRDAGPSGGAHREPAVSADRVAQALAPGTRVGGHIIERTDADVAGELRVTVSRGEESLHIRLRPWEPSRPAQSRRGAWALDLDAEGEPSAAARAAVGALARLLPAGDYQQGPAAVERAPAAPRATAAAACDGVICTAPWTTLEIVDPDGRVRQCCADWTVGERGNLHDRLLAEVWNGAGYRMARRVMGAGTLGDLCRPICPRLYDAKFAQGELAIVPGAGPFVANQQLLFEDIAEHREVVRAQPLYVAVCPSTYCNYNCIMCLHGRTPRRDLPESIWQELLAMLPTLHVLTLLGGEPLANPLAMGFLRAWDRTRYPDAAMSLVTNGSLLGAGVLARLERCSFGSVTISLNAGTSAVYEQVQRGIALDEVLANVDALIDFRRRQGSRFPIVLSFVVQPANHATLIAFGELARQRGLPLRLMPLSPHGPDGLDFYDDADQVGRILESLDAMAAWAASGAPDYLREIHGTRTAIATEAAGRLAAP